MRGASVVQGSPEKIKRETDYWDMATLMKQLGVLPNALNEAGRVARVALKYDELQFETIMLCRC